MKAEDIRDMGSDEIRERIQQLSEERFRLRFRSGMMELDNPSLLRTLRRDIARLRTILHQQEQQEETA